MSDFGKPEPLAETDLDAAAGGRIVFSDLIVSSYQTGGSKDGATSPSASLALNSAKIEQGR